MKDPDAVVELVERAVERLRGRYRSRGNETALRVYEDYVLEREVESCFETLQTEVRREIRSSLAELTPDEKSLEEEWDGLFGG